MGRREDPEVESARITADASWRVSRLSALVAVATAIISTLGTLWISSSQLRNASSEVSAARAEAERLLAFGVPLGTLIPSSLGPEQFEKAIGQAVLGPVDKTIWTLANGGNVRGSRFAALSGSETVPNLQGFDLQEVQIASGTSTHGGDLLSKIDSKHTGDWHWLVSLRNADPQTSYVEWEQRMQRIKINSDNPRSVVATAQIFEAKNGRFADATAAEVNFLGVAQRRAHVLWYIKIN